MLISKLNPNTVLFERVYKIYFNLLYYSFYRFFQSNYCCCTAALLHFNIFFMFHI